MAEPLKDLKDCLDALEKLKTIRRELKSKLGKEELEPEKEKNLAHELLDLSTGIEQLEKKKLELARAIK